MVENVTITVYTEMTRLGEVIFTVRSHTGIHKSKCLHDALSNADIKMTGIDGIIGSAWNKMKTSEHFLIESKHIRFNDRVERETETTD